MKKVFFLMLFLMILGTASFAQVRIGGNGVPHGAAVLDLNVNDTTNNGTKTLALPRVRLASTADKMGNAVLLGGMLVYNTGGTISEGVYYWDGSQWVKPNSTAYTGSTSVTLSGTSFQRAALTGDVTAAANANATTIGDGKVTNVKIATGAVDSIKIASNAIKTVHINNNAVTSAKIADGTIVAADLADGAVTSAKILDGTIATADIAANAIDSTKIKDKGVGYGDLTTAGATSGQVLKYNGTAWMPAADLNDNTTYTASTSITLSGTSFQRAALTGDVTAAANNNATTIGDGKVTSAKLADNAVSTAKIANNAVTVAKLPTGATGTTFLRGDGTWVTPTNTTYTGSTSITLSGTSFQRPALTGDVTAAANSNATTIANGAVTAAKLNAMGAADGDMITRRNGAWVTEKKSQWWERQLILNPTNTIAVGAWVEFKMDTAAVNINHHGCYLIPQITPSVGYAVSGVEVWRVTPLQTAAAGALKVLVRCLY
jgi:hypothetical protein